MKSIIKPLFFFLLSPFIIRRGQSSQIYLTFDDGPHPNNTITIVEILARHKCQAIFFMTGKEMEKYPAIVNRVITDGHKIAFHGYAHDSMRKQSRAEFNTEMLKKAELEQQFNIRLDLYRPPFGDLTIMGMLSLIKHRCKIIMWSLDSRDSYDTEQQVLSTLSASKLRPGEIILFHDDYSKTSGLLDKLLTEYHAAKITCGVRL